MFLHEIIEYAARRAPDASALTFDGGDLAFASFGDRVARLATSVRRAVPGGGRVALLSENHPDVVTAYYAVPAGGAILTLLNYRLNPAEWAAMLEDSEATVVIGERALLDALRPVMPGGVDTIVALDRAAAGEQAFERWLSTDPERRPLRSDTDPAWIIYTSGTTGRPKGATLTHRSLLTAVLGLDIARPVQPDDVYLFPFPLCHVAGYNVLAFHLHARPVVLMRRFEAGEVLANIERHRVTQVSLAPTMIDMVLDHPDVERYDRSSLRGIGYGASAMPARVLRRTVSELGCDLSQGYGMTELSGNVAYLGADEHRAAAAGDERLLVSAGQPSVLASMRVVDDYMRDAPTGTPGEIVVRGDQVMTGYWRDDRATAEAFAGGWFHTGDVGRFDEHGTLAVVDRKKDIIVSGGENIASREVEEVLALHPGVKDVAVIGLPDPTWGENVCAVIVMQPGANPDADELVALCRSRLAGYKKPKRVVFVDDLPKNAAGKVMKSTLRESLRP